MKLGAFSISLAVKDLAVSKQFYQKLGFEIVGGDESQNWLIVRNGDNTIGLFQGMFDSNIMTFNPGWDAKCNSLESFDSVQDISQALESQGVELSSKPQSKSGPGSAMLVDPDGNTILIDQHV